MKTILFTMLIIVLAHQWTSVNSSNNDTALRLPPNKERFVEMVGKRLKSLWVKFTREENKETFMERCFGIAKKLNMAIPLAVFKLGVILTLLAFLTIFSMKSLGLLGLLLLITVSSIVSKITLAFASKHEEHKIWKPPQTIHFHVHQEKDGHYYADHTGSGWDDRMGHRESEEYLNSLESYNLYNKLSRNPYLRSHRATYT